MIVQTWVWPTMSMVFYAVAYSSSDARWCRGVMKLHDLVIDMLAEEHAVQ